MSLNKNKRVAKDAERDAFEFARAQMFYGEGAGTRRKMIGAIVNHKGATIPGYSEAFDLAYASQNFLEHAEAAHKERRRKDMTSTVDRNVRGLITGNRQSLTTGVAVVASVWYVAHETGYDKKVEAEIKRRYVKAKRWASARRAEFQLRRNIKNHKNI